MKGWAATGLGVSSRSRPPIIKAIPLKDNRNKGLL
jgi:hypothetical protein